MPGRLGSVWSIRHPGACAPCGGAAPGRPAPVGCASARGSRACACGGGCWVETSSSRSFAFPSSVWSSSPAGAGVRRLARARDPAGIRARSILADSILAERVGFEPTDRLRDQRFSRPPRSTTPAPLRFSLKPLAERVGFEPTVGGYPTHAFQACSLSHSDTSPSCSRSAGAPRERGVQRTSPAPRRRRSKKRRSSSALSAASTPPTTSTRWLSRGSRVRSPRVPQ